MQASSRNRTRNPTRNKSRAYSAALVASAATAFCMVVISGSPKSQSIGPVRRPSSGSDTMSGIWSRTYDLGRSARDGSHQRAQIFLLLVVGLVLLRLQVGERPV